MAKLDERQHEQQEHGKDERRFHNGRTSPRSASVAMIEAHHRSLAVSDKMLRRMPDTAAHIKGRVPESQGKCSGKRKEKEGWKRLPHVYPPRLRQVSLSVTHRGHLANTHSRHYER
jgi:hypothetical protein